MDMQHFTLELFRKDDSRFELRILDQDKQILSKENYIEQAGIDTLAEQTATKDSIIAADLMQRGQYLFDWVDHNSKGWLREIRQTPQHMALTIDSDDRESKLRYLPWELLHDGVNYLCGEALHLFTPLRKAGGNQQHWKPEKRSLSVLFMASSPENVQPVLGFEAEEAGILAATARKPVDLQVEESGSLSGLEERLTESGQAPDVIHISGHADVAGKQPVFMLEDDIGLGTPATPEALGRTLLSAGQYPRLAFLSGCRTGQSDHESGILSFSEQIVNMGVPVVLGWALPVGDASASQAAAALYDKLATGFSIPQAVASARQQLSEQGSPYWHLLQCYVDNSPLNPLITKGRIRFKKPHTPRAFLDAGNQIPVCSRHDFIGRRRLIQRCLRSLRAWSDDAHYAEGVLLHGMGGLGKSSAAARLVDRLRPAYLPVVCYGGLDETVLLSALGKALPGSLSLLNDAERTLEQRLRLLFEPEGNPYTDQPILLVFDDFEQNIPKELRGRATASYNPDSLTILNTVLKAIHDADSDSRVIVTSRFAVPVASPCRLYPATPETLQETDLAKKLSQLPGLQLDTAPTQFDKTLRLRAREIGAGNPRLLEWLNTALLEQSEGAAGLLSQLEAVEDKFREELLIETLVDAQPSPVRKTLASAAIYELPVKLAAIEALTGDTRHTGEQLKAAAKFGLVEMTGQDEHPQYFASALLDKALADELPEDERKRLSGEAAQYLYETKEHLSSERLGLETVRLAVTGNNQNVAIEVGNRIASSMLSGNRYREAETLCRGIHTLGDDYRILTQLARAEQLLGRKETREHFERAVALLPDTDNGQEVSDAELRKKSATLFNYTSLLIQQGETNQALSSLKEQVLPMLEKLGDVRSKAVTLGQIADIYQARGELDKALSIRQNDELPVYEKLGDVREKAVTLGKIADIYQARGELDKALSIRQNDSLPILEKLGDVRSLLVGRTNLAILLWQMNPEHNATQVQELLNLALADARRLQIPEAAQIEGIMQQYGLSGETPVNPALLRTLEDGESLYPEHYQQMTCQQLCISYFSGNKRVNLWTAISLPEHPHTVDEIEFLSLLTASPSLDMDEKSRVLTSYSQLESEQIDSLLRIFKEESEQFKTLGKEHLPQIDSMQDKKLLEWLEWENQQFTTSP